METLVITPEIQQNQFHVKLPDDFENNKFIVQIVFQQIDRDMQEEQNQKKRKEQLNKITQFAGIFKDATYQINETEWYKQ